jgi:hypothetical protein
MMMRNTFKHTKSNTIHRRFPSTVFPLAIILSLALFIPSTSAKITRNVPKLDRNTWANHDQEFFSSIHPAWKDFTAGLTNPEQFATDYNAMLANFLESKPEFQEEAKEYFRHNPPSSNSLEQARKLKNSLRKRAKKQNTTDEDRAAANQALRHYNFLLKEQKAKNDAKETNDQEKAYRKNFHKFAKDITNDTFGQPSVTPTYSRDIANNFYMNKYSSPVVIDPTKLNWFPEVTQPSSQYNLNPYRPQDIKNCDTAKEAGCVSTAM